MTRELLPGRSVHDRYGTLRRLDRIGVPGLLVFIGLCCGGMALSQLDGVTYGPWVWWVAGIVGFPSWLAAGAWIVGGRLIIASMGGRREAEHAAGYTTSRYAPNFMIRPPEIDHVDGESGRIVRLAGEPWLTEAEYEARIRAIREAAGHDEA
ncbi:hypothetical protein [Promicromonospora sukumoe]|uniref:hypothetical protein n=1 Tax=Promicromonospora sukumoe TaxID=88382 RepID=UPI003668899C